MPGYVLHLTLAGMVYDLLQKEDAISGDSDTWKETFIVGSVFPDVLIGAQKEVSHQRTVHYKLPNEDNLLE